MRERIRRRGRQSGFTLVELLVVISIIGMLIALLLPAVNAARETARSANCLSNLTNLGKATISYESRQGSYPGYNNVQAFRSRTFDLQSVQLTGAYDAAVQYPSPTGWVFPLLAYLDRNDLAEQYGPRGQDTAAFNGYKGVPPNNITLKIVQCPSDITATDEGATGSSYVANTGFENVTAGGGGLYAEIDVNNGVSPDYAANGVFQNHYCFTLAATDHEKYDKWGPTSAPAITGFAKGNWKEVKTSASGILSGDGTTNTLLMAENIDGGRWTDYFEHQVGFVCAPAIKGANNPVKPSADSTTTLYGTLADPSRTVAAVYWMNEGAGGKATKVSSDSPYKWARPSSYHANGVNVFFAGGNGRLLTDTIDPHVYVQLMSPHGSKMVVPSKDGADMPTGDWIIYAKPLDEGAF